MQKRYFYESSKALTDRKLTDICTYVDPFGLGVFSDISIQIEVCKSWETRSKVQVVMQDSQKVIKETDWMQDWGFATSFASDSQAAKTITNWTEEFSGISGVNIIQKVRLTGLNCVLDQKRDQPFYMGTVSIHEITHNNWQRGTKIHHWKPDDPTPDDKFMNQVIKEDFVVYTNGNRSLGFERLLARLEGLLEKEASGEDRYGQTGEEFAAQAIERINSY